MDKKTVFFTIMMMSCLVSALEYNLEYKVYNFNTYVPVYQANVSILGSTSDTQLTDNFGLAELAATSGYYNVTIIKNGYFGYSDTGLNVSNSTVKTVYLTQSGTEGLITLRINDLTLSDHGFTLFYDNGRFKGHYEVNDTVVIHNNVNYTLVPDVKRFDMISSTGKMEKNLYSIMPVILSILVLLLLCMVILGMMTIVYHKVRGKK